MFNKKSSLVLFSLTVLSSSSFAAIRHRGGAELLNPGAYGINLGASIFNTSGYYDQDGEESEKVEDTKFSMIDVDFALSYGLSKSLEISGFGRYRNIKSTADEVESANSGPESLGAEIKYGFDPVGNARYAIGVHYRQTLYSNASYATIADRPGDEVVLGDAGSEYGADLYLTYLMNSFKFDARVGYSSPANDLSDEITYKFEGLYRFTRFGLFAGVEGIKSLENDPYKDTPGDKPIQAVGASSLFNSIDREKVAPYLGANYAFDKFLLSAKAQQVVSGVSTDKGATVGLNIVWNTEGVSPESVKVESFKEYQVDGSVLKVSARGNFVRIDQGLATDVEKGMKFDIYQTDYFGGNVLVASGTVYEVGADWSIIKLVKKYKEIEIKPGFAARGY